MRKVSEPKTFRLLERPKRGPRDGYRPTLHDRRVGPLATPARPGCLTRPLPRPKGGSTTSSAQRGVRSRCCHGPRFFRRPATTHGGGMAGLLRALRTLHPLGHGPSHDRHLQHFDADDGQATPVRVLGYGDPPVVLVHGLGCTHRHWMPVARRLARRHRPLLRELLHGIPRLVAVGARIARGRGQARMSEDGLDDVRLDAAGHRMTPERVSQPVGRGRAKVSASLFMPFLRISCSARSSASPISDRSSCPTALGG